MESRDQQPCYIAIKACGCVVAAAVDHFTSRKETARSVASWIRQGHTVERQTVAWVRDHMKRCPHAGDKSFTLSGLVDEDCGL